MKNIINKKSVSALLAAVLSISVLTGCGSSDSSQGSISDSTETTRVYAATSANPKPFTYVDDNNELTGHNIELLKAVFDKLPQYELIFETTDFTSIFAGLDSDRYQIGANNFTANDERKEKYLFSDAMFENCYVAVVASESTLKNIEDLSALTGKTYIGNAGINVTTAVEKYNENNPDNQIEMYYTEAEMIVQLQEVESGKYDFLLMDKPMFNYYIKEYDLDVKCLELSGDVSAEIMTQPYSYFLISKGNEQLLKDINKALAEVIEEGVSKKINEKYFDSDYTPYNE